MSAINLVELWRGPFLESVHRGHAVICRAGEIVESWGDPQHLIFPRSSVKMIQALPLLESGAARAAGLGAEQLALCCASHQGAAIHTDRVGYWLKTLDLDESALRCGPQMPKDPVARDHITCSHDHAGQMHNNCSGKHAGFLTLNRHLGGGSEYIDVDHPVQQAVRGAFEEVTGESSPGYGIDGCSAPNFACTVAGLARAMAGFAGATKGNTRGDAQVALRNAMMRHPDLVAGEGRACTELMRAMDGKVAIKTGAEAVFVAILPEQQLGIALKIEDGSTRAAECAIAALLVRLGVLDPNHPATLRRMNVPQLNRRGMDTGILKPTAALAV